MAKSLIIVESPTKIKTLRKFLPKNFRFESSVGHIRDLPQKGFGIDIENDFNPVYQTLPEKKDVIAKLKKEAAAADIVYLAPDPDREGEAIAWHIAAILPKKTEIKRITFNEITRDAVQEAIEHPRPIDQHLVDAQQARRLLDRIVGYKISPLLQRRVQKGKDGFLSAGRVQSVALKLVVDREKEIDAFIPVEYWNLGATLQDGSKPFYAGLHTVDGKRIEKEPKKGCITIPNEQSAKEIAEKLKSASYKTGAVEKKEKKRHPVPPFITSTLQQEASRHYGFPASRTMSIAQSLYEGVDLGSEGTEGLITYMRTDSVRVANEAITHGRGFIEKTYGKEYLPEKPKQYASKKGAQDAHEAIRPTNLAHPPEQIKKFLNVDQFKIYSLIWKRFLASQMTSAIYDTVAALIETNANVELKVTGSTLKFNGFLAAYQEKSDSEETEEKENLLPPLKEGQDLKLVEVKSEQAFTKPPARFSEASLVKELEKSGIGRPSTYATIMNKIQSRSYTTKEKLYLKPTELGKVIVALLDTSFGMIMDVNFTASMEKDLDGIAEGDREWKAFVREFWDKFNPLLETAEKEAHVPKQDTDIDCPECGSKLQKIWAKSKYFYGCSRYPDCGFTAPLEGLNFNKEDYAKDFDWDQPCPKCSEKMQVRHGRYGPFLGCTKYPDCKGIVNIQKEGELPPEDLPNCPAIGCTGKLTQRKSRYGKTFFSCTEYPDCDVIGNEVDQVLEKYKEHPKTAYVKKARKPGAKRTGGGPKYKLSKDLAAIIGKKDMTRGEVTKALWVYIKENNLQDPKNKRRIIPDEKLKKIFAEPIDMMQLAGTLKDHLSK